MCVRARSWRAPCVKSVRPPAYVRVCARARERARAREGEDRCVSGSLCVDLGRRLLYITFKADNIIAWPDK